MVSNIVSVVKIPGFDGRFLSHQIPTVTVKRNVYSEFCSHFLDTCPLELCFGELLAMACPNFLSHQTPETSTTTSQTNTFGEGDMVSYYRNLQVLEVVHCTRCSEHSIVQYSQGDCIVLE